MLHIDNKEVRLEQVERLNMIKKSRDSKAVEAILDKITDAAKTGNNNLLELAIEAARLRATVGEISYAIEKVSGRHVA